MIVGARLKAEHRQALTIGWYSGSFGRVERMKPLADYLKPALSPEQKRNEGARKVLAMFERVKRKQEAASGPG